ncbi:hypothetical protein HN415_00310 [Candidatus Woesearchaeota archaeon]|jgi:GABA(A) receptor-associated protein|nr:hypothetical protein [Candidatus Woesearchaeota archaeon]
MNDKNLDLDKRKAEANKMLEKYPDRIPIIVTKSRRSTLSDIDKNKFLVPVDLTVGQFMYVVRKRIKNIDSTQAIYLFINNTLPQITSLIGEVYKNNKNKDNFLYIEYNGEETFG